MSVLPASHVAQLKPMTAAEYAALSEDEHIRYELQEGALVMPPRPLPDHQRALFELGIQLRPQVPADLQLLLEVDLDLELVTGDRPGTVRVPDLLVVTQRALERVRNEGGLLRASETVLAIEILSAGSKRTDRIIKRGEYADAGIGYYWMVELVDGPSLTACHLAGNSGYVEAGTARGVFSAEAPFPARLNLDALA